MIRSSAVSIWFACALAAPATGQVTVDGDLADLASVAQGSLADPANDVCNTGNSGFDVTHLYVYYDGVADALYLGIDILDVPGAPGVPGDADGDRNADTRTSPFCVAFPFSDELGVGPDEYYQFLLDTNSNNRSDEAVDVRVQYSNNALGIFPGNSTVPIPGATGIIRLGTAGSASASAGIPDGDENRSTTDVEVRIDRWSSLDPDPADFTVTLHAGSIVDGLPEEFTSRLHVDLRACATGTVNAGPGPITDVLLVNASSGDAGSRIVHAAIGARVALSLVAAPAGPSSARYVVWIWPGFGSSQTSFAASGSILGCTVNPTPLAPNARPQPFRCLHGTGIPSAACRGTTVLHSPARAPWTAARQTGFATPAVLTFQGIVEDTGSATPAHFSVTNAVTLVVQ
jgi:hypothetical protein